MAPVAGGIANTQEDGLVFGTGFGKGFFAPWIPINRILFVL